MMLFVDPLKRIAVENALEDLEGTIHPFKFTQEGTQSWKV